MKEVSADMEKYKGFLSYVKFNDGVNSMEIDTKAKLEKSKFGRTTYVVILNGTRGKLSLPKSVEMQVLNAIKNGKTAFRVTKTGKGLETRYSVI